MSRSRRKKKKNHRKMQGSRDSREYYPVAAKLEPPVHFHLLRETGARPNQRPQLHPSRVTVRERSTTDPGRRKPNFARLTAVSRHLADRLG